MNPPTPSLGGLLIEGQGFMTTQPWMVIYPGVALTLGVYGFNLVGDSLRDLAIPGGVEGDPIGGRRRCHAARGARPPHMCGDNDQQPSLDALPAYRGRDRCSLAIRLVLGATVAVARLEGKAAGFSWYIERGGFGLSGYLSCSACIQSCVAEEWAVSCSITLNA